uniref:Protein pitchfork n=2 Tax=Podarcis muralis TaxID=64176 RepID=A0A670JCW4_PODMU
MPLKSGSNIWPAAFVNSSDEMTLYRSGLPGVANRFHLGAFPWQQGGSPPKRSALSLVMGQRQLTWELSAAQQRNSFGSCQERKIFPVFYPPDRLGNENVPIKGDPDRGPGAYNYAEKDNLLYQLARRPESTKGYTMGARTTPRFGLLSKHVTPDPTAYQSIWIRDHHRRQPTHVSFCSNMPRFSEKLLDKDFYPGPGTYDPYGMPHRHVTWPGKFGAPDWSLIPMPAKRTLRSELLSDKEFRKHRNLVAYLSIYYSD